MLGQKLKSRRYLKPVKSYYRFRFSGRHLGFPVGDDGFFGDGTIEKPVPENLGRE